MQSWERLQKLKQADPKEFAKLEHLHTNHPLLYKTPQEARKMEHTLRKYFNCEKKNSTDKKAAAMFGEATKTADNSADSTASASDEECTDLYFSEEEILLMSDQDKLIYMTKLQHDFVIINKKLTEVIEKVKKARKEATAAIEGGNETLKMYADYHKRMNKLVGNVTENLGCY